MDAPLPDSSSITPAASSTPRPPPTPVPAPAPGSSQPHPPPAQPQDPSSIQDDDPESPHQEHAPSSSSSALPPPRPPFSPLFTLIHDPSSSSAPIHPRNTHYIFSDDDAGSILSPVCSRAATHPLIADPSQPNTTTAGPEERILIVDLDQTGTRVTRAASLNPKWQVLRASIANSPTLRGVAEGDEAAGGGGAMLKIDGMGIMPPPPSSSAGGVKEVEWGWKRDDSEDEQEEEGDDGVDVDIDIESEAMRALVADFERRMEVLRSVVLGDGTGEVVEAGSAAAGLGPGNIVPLTTGEEKEKEKEEKEEKGDEE